MQILWLFISFTFMGALVYGLCRMLRLNPIYAKIDRPKRSALCSLASVSASMLILSVLILTSHKHGSTQGMAHRHQRHLVDQLFLLFLYFLPMVLMLRLNGETLQSAGFARANLWKATVVGLFLAATTTFNARGGPGAAFKLTDDHNVHSLIFFSFVGFGEEILYRGYLQSRLIAWLGRYQGWILASVIMALMHLPARLPDMGFPGAFAFSFGLIPISLLMGFVMLRTGSVVSSSLFHTFADWMCSG